MIGFIRTIIDWLDNRRFEKAIDGHALPPRPAAAPHHTSARQRPTTPRKCRRRW